jgi:hypothetical protein
MSPKPNKERCRKTCAERPDKNRAVTKSEDKKKVHMYAQNWYILSWFLRPYYTSGSAEGEARTRRPAGDLTRRIPPWEAGHPHTSIIRTRTATHDRAFWFLQATTRKHAPQAHNHITKAATAANVTFPESSTVREAGTVVWGAGKLVPGGVVGLLGGKADADGSIQLEIASGDYLFSATWSDERAKQDHGTASAISSAPP